MNNSTLERLQSLFQDEIKKEAERINLITPAALYEPVSYALKAGGKRLRPVMLLLAAEMFSKNSLQAIPAAIAIEVFHNFTLLHDDVMDNASIRRGKPTVHKKYSENTAILSGDTMSIMACMYLCELEAVILPDILSLFTKTGMEICEGQQFDMEFETREDITVDEYIEMIRLKTAVLIGCSLKMGAIIGHADETAANLLYDFGINIGLAFQLQDDWLDVFGDTKAFGKKIGGDIMANKKTFLLVKTLELCNEKTKNELKKWLETCNNDDQKIKAVTRIYKDTQADMKAKELMIEYYNKALSCMAQLELPEDKKAPLYIIAKNIITRIK